MNGNNKAPIIACARHRIQSDGHGVTTLVLLYGCPLRCEWCINPYSFDPRMRRETMTAQMLYDKIKVDELYFVATGGGVTFGGGEPLLHSDFIAEFCELCDESWHICVETSLAVPWENLFKVIPYIDMFYVDCKDMNSDIYQQYTGCDNRLVKENLKRMLEIVGADKIVIRLPLIPNYNTEEDRARSMQELSEMGFHKFDLFTYKTK